MENAYEAAKVEIKKKCKEFDVHLRSTSVRDNNLVVGVGIVGDCEFHVWVLFDSNNYKKMVERFVVELKLHLREIRQRADRAIKAIEGGE